MSDLRPIDCRFRLQDEGKAYPRSACTACKKTITTGLGRECTFPADHATKVPAFRPLTEEDVQALRYIGNIAYNMKQVATDEKCKQEFERISHYADEILRTPR